MAIDDTEKSKTQLGEIPKRIRLKTPEEFNKSGNKSTSFIGGEGSSAFGSFLGNVVSGAASTLAAPFEAIDRTAAALAGVEYRPEIASPVGKLGQGIEKAAAAIASPAPERADLFSSKLGQGLGSTAGFAAPLALVRGAGGLAAASGLGATATGVEQAKDYENKVKESGLELKQEDQAASFFYGLAPGLIEGVPLYRALGRLDDITRGGLKAAVKNTAKGTAEEAIQEGLQSAASNLIASNVVKYDEGRDLFFDTPEAAAVGGGVGFILNSAMSAFGLTKAKKTFAKAADNAQSTSTEDIRSSEENLVNPATGLPIENADLAKSYKFIERSRKLSQTDPENASAYEQRISDLEKEIRTKYFSKDEEGNYTSSAADRQEATDILTRINVEENTVEDITIEAPADEKIEYPDKKGISVREITSEKRINKFLKDLENNQISEEILIEAFDEKPTTDGISVTEFDGIEDITLDTTPTIPDTTTFTNTKPANTALADQLQRALQQRENTQQQSALRDQTDSSFNQRKESEINEAYRQREMQIAEENATAVQEVQKEVTPSPATVYDFIHTLQEPTIEAPVEESPKTKETPKQVSGTPEGAIIPKSGKGYRTEGIASFQMKKKGIEGTIVEYAPDQFAIIPKETQDGQGLQGQETTEEVKPGKEYFTNISNVPYIDDSLKSGDASITEMSPDEYIAATDRGFSQTYGPDFSKGIDQNKVQEYAERFRNGEKADLPYLNNQTDAQGNLTFSQEGRHRALALKELGVEKIPVVIRNVQQEQVEPEIFTQNTEVQDAQQNQETTEVYGDVQQPEVTQESEAGRMSAIESGQGVQEAQEVIIEVPEGMIGKSDGTPFKTERAAKSARTRKGLGETHDIVSVDGGFVLRVKDPSVIDTIPELNNSPSLISTDQDQVIKSPTKEIPTSEPVIQEPFIEEVDNTITISSEVYDEVLALAELRKAGEDPSKILERMTKSFSPAEFAEYYNGITNGIYVPSEEGYTGKQTPVGEVEDTSITQPEMPDPDDLLIQSKNRLLDIEDQLDEIEFNIIEAEELGDSRRIASLKLQRKKIEELKRATASEYETLAKQEEDEIVRISREENDFQDFDDWELIPDDSSRPTSGIPLKLKDIELAMKTIYTFNKSLSKNVPFKVRLIVDPKKEISRPQYEWLQRSFGTSLPTGLHLRFKDERKVEKREVWVFAKPGRTVEDYQRTLFHEVIGHYGLQDLFREKFDSFKDAILKNPDFAAKAYSLNVRWNFDLTPLSKEDTIYITDKYSHIPSTIKTKSFAIKKDTSKVAVSREGMRKLVEEYLSEIASDFTNQTFQEVTKEEVTLLKRFVAWIRHFLRKSGFGKIVDSEITENDIIAIISESVNRNIKDGRPLNLPALEKRLETYMTNSHKGEDAERVTSYFKKKAEKILDAQAHVDMVVEEGSNIGLFSKKDADAILKSMNSHEGRIDTSPYQQFWNRQTDRIRRSKYTKHLSSLGHLTFPKIYNFVENKAKGSMNRGTIMAKEWANATKNLNEVQQRAVYDYFVTKDSSHTDLPVPTKIQNLAKKNKDFITEMGEALVKLGVLTRKTYEQNKGSYLPLRYYKYLEGYYAGGKKLSLQNYLKKQAGLSDAEKQALGQIKDPSFLVAETVATLGRDVALRTMFQNMITMSNQGGLGWILGAKHKIEVLGKKMTLSDIYENIELKKNLLQLGDGMPPVWLEQGGIELIQQHLDALEVAKTEAERLMKEEAKEAIINRGIPGDQITEAMLDQIIKAEYVRVDDKRYGRLHNKYVRKEIYDDIVDSGDFMNKEHTDFLASIFGAGGTADKANQYWKAGKVVLNPPSWVRNFFGNMVLLDIGTNTNSFSLTKMLVDEINTLRTGKLSKYNTWAHEYGLFNTTYSAAELNLISKQFQDTFKAKVEITNPTNGPFKKLWWMFDKSLHSALEKATNIYGGMEGLFKTVALRDYIEIWEKKNGTSIDSVSNNIRQSVIREGIEHANKNIFDYSKVPHWMRSMRRMPFVGAPFLTYTFKAIPQSIESFVRRPQKFIKYALFPYAMAQMFLHTQDLDDDDLEEIQRNMPKWMKEKSSVFILPVKDANGKWQAMDFGYYLPWAAMHNLYLMANKTFDPFNPVLSSGQSVLNGATDLGFLGGPFPAMISAALTNKDPFSGREIIRSAGTSGDKVNDFLTYMLDLWIPTFLTSKGVLGRTLDNLGLEPTPFNTGRELTSYGSDRDTAVQAGLRGAGINVYGFSESESRASNIKAFNFEKRKLDAAKRQIVKDRNLSPQNKAAKIRDINEQLKFLYKKRKEELTGNG